MLTWFPEVGATLHVDGTPDRTWCVLLRNAAQLMLHTALPDFIGSNTWLI